MKSHSAVGRPRAGDPDPHDLTRCLPLCDRHGRGGTLMRYGARRGGGRRGPARPMAPLSPRV